MPQVGEWVNEKSKKDAEVGEHEAAGFLDYPGLGYEPPGRTARGMKYGTLSDSLGFEPARKDYDDGTNDETTGMTREERRQKWLVSCFAVSRLLHSPSCFLAVKR